MSLMTMLEQSHGGGLFAAVARSLDIDEAQTRRAMGKLCPVIAAGLHDRAAEDEDIFQSLLDLIEQGADGAPQGSSEALTGPEAIADGNAILDDVFGSRSAAMAALRKADDDIPERELSKLAPISATAVVQALAQANRPLALTTPLSARASAGEGFMGALIAAIVAGIVAALKKQFAPRSRRTTGYARTRSRRKSTTSRSRTTRRRTAAASASVEEIFRDVLGRIGK